MSSAVDAETVTLQCFILVKEGGTAVNVLNSVMWFRLRMTAGK